MDVGCGIGLMAEFMRRRIRHVRALDISEKNIAFAKETVRDVDFVVSDFLSFPTESSFDLITFFDVLEHFPREKLPDVVTKVSLLSHEETSVPRHDPQRRLRPLEQGRQASRSTRRWTFSCWRICSPKRAFKLRRCHVYELDYQDQYRFLWLARRSANWTPAKLQEPKLTKLLRLTHGSAEPLALPQGSCPLREDPRRRR